MVTALLIIRTPLQAKLSEIVLAQEGITEYDLLYLTQRKTEKTMWYFRLLARRARRNSLLFVPQWIFDSLTDLSFYLKGLCLGLIWRGKYDLVIFGSLDSLSITGLAAKFANRYITVDDGSANIDQGPRGYFQQRTGPRQWILKNLTGAPALAQVKDLVERHYTLFPDHRNTVDQTKLVQISDWPPKRARRGGLEPIVIYIGMAESLWLSPVQIEAMRQYLASRRIDFYIPHPMEKQALLSGISILPHPELLAEEALARVPSKSPLHLIAAVSTVLFTTKKIATVRTMLVPKGFEKLIPLARESGCEIVRLSE